tara:strand:- start:128 stop:589 length:462 start_codon:yes stop_codon:yes gene_type:complete
MSNIEKIRKMAKGIYKRPIQVGYEGKKTSQRKEGEEWVDPRGHKWVIKDGKRKQITKIPPRGFDKCGTCDKMILKDIDQDTFNRMSRCYHCQLEFEADLHREGKWQDWVKEMETKRWESVLAEYEQEMKSLDDGKGAFDKTVANAIANNEHKK